MIRAERRSMRKALIFYLVLNLACIVAVGCATAKQAENASEESEQDAERPVSAKQSLVPADLLPTLEVTIDSCHVFLQPKGSSPYFGPLVKGEKIKWLDAHRNWVRVWIPRLRASGWVSNSEVSETNEKPDIPADVPESLLSTVTVTSKRANIRVEPTTRSPIIARGKENDKFWVLNEKMGWYQIWLLHLNKKGWISGKIVKRDSGK